MKLLILLLVLFVALSVVATVMVVLWSLLGWLAIPAYIVLLIGAAWGAKWLFFKGLEKAFMTPFKMKGAPLRDATTQLHGVEFATSGEGEKLVLIDLTITPPATVNGPFRHWDPTELQLIKHGTPTGAPRDEEETFEITKAEIWRGGAFAEMKDEPAEERPEGAGNEAPRLRLHAKVPAAERRLAIRYYFEVFGDVQLPPQPAEARVTA